MHCPAKLQFFRVLIIVELIKLSKFSSFSATTIVSAVCCVLYYQSRRSVYVGECLLLLPLLWADDQPVKMHYYLSTTLHK